MAVTKTISAGLINKPVIFKQPTSSLNNEGGDEVEYSTGITTRAFVTRFNEFRATEANVTSLIGAFDFYIRYRSAADAVNKDWLIEYRGEDYVIHAIELIDQEQRFYRFTAKSKGTAVISQNGSSVGDYPEGGAGSGGIDPDVDLSHLKFTITSTTGGWVLVYIPKFTAVEESLIDWGDGNSDVVAAGPIISGLHEFAPGEYSIKVYPINGVTAPTAPSVSIVDSIKVSVDTGEDPGDLQMLEVGASLEACTMLRFLELRDWSLTALPDLPTSGPEQVRIVDMPGNNLSGPECSQILVQLDQINWPVGEVHLTGSDTGNLSEAGEAAKNSLIAKGWLVNL
jgi:SPP1 family predicted phage head-tail adaptor